MAPVPIAAFVAYPAHPGSVAATIHAASEAISAQSGETCETWEEIDIAGRFIADEILQKIDASQCVVEN
jgi:hypothetical protein